MMVARKSRILVRSQFHERQHLAGNEEEFKLEEYHIVDLDQNIIHRHIASPLLIGKGIQMREMVSLGDSVYIFGGCETQDDVTKVDSYKSLNSADIFYKGSAHLQIVDHDDGKVSGVWRENPELVIGRLVPSCTTLNGKIYNLGFLNFSPQVFDPTTNCWEDICSSPSELKGFNLAIKVLSDASANRILFHLQEVEVEEETPPSPSLYAFDQEVEEETPTSPSLYAFYTDLGKWELMVSDFELWCKAMTTADDVIYFNYFKCPNLIRAYDLKNLKWLDVHCSVTAIDGWDISDLRRLKFDHLFSLGDASFCLTTTLHVFPEPKSISYGNGNWNNDGDNCKNEFGVYGYRDCKVVFLLFTIERTDSTINLVPQSVRSFELPHTSFVRQMLLLS